MNDRQRRFLSQRQSRVAIGGVSVLGLLLAIWLVPRLNLRDEPAILDVDIESIDPAWFADHFDLPPEVLAAEEHRFCDELTKHLLSQNPVAGLPTGFIRERRDTIDNYHEGQLILGNEEPVEFQMPFSWSYPDRSTTFNAELHSLRFVTNFLDAYLESGEQEYLAVVKSALEGWVESNPHGDAAHPRAWHEGAVAKRALVLTNILNECRNRNEELVPIPQLIALLLQHAEFLIGEETYRPAGNHGIRQDIGLFVLSLALSEARNRLAWQATATARLRDQQIAIGFTQSYVWKEHSPGYHYYVLRLFRDLAEIVESNDVSLESDFLSSLVNEGTEYMAWATAPDGRIVPIGDTEPREVISRGAIADHPMVQRAAGRIEAASPGELDAFFTDAGDVAVRDTWGDDVEQYVNSTYVFAHTAFHNEFDHRHADDLSFVMFSMGRWWIIEGGKYRYTDDEWRRYLISERAHNSYVANGRTVPAYELSAGGAGIDDTVVSTPRLAAWSAWTDRLDPDDARARRTFVFLRSRRTLVLIDSLESDAEAEWTAYLQLPADLTVRLDSTLLTATPIEADRSSAQMQIALSPDHLRSVSVEKGSLSPRHGWYSPAYGEIEALSTVLIRRSGSSLDAAAVIRIGAVDAAPIGPVSIISENDLITLNWNDGDARIELKVARKPALQVDFIESIN